MSKENIEEPKHFHISVNGEAIECVASIRSCPRGGEAVYLRAMGVEGPARPSVREASLYGVREQFYEVKRGGSRVGGSVSSVSSGSKRRRGDFTVREQEEREVKAAEAKAAARESSRAYHTRDVRVLDELSNSDRAFTRVTVARNKSTSAETLERLSSDDDVFVRANVATNPRVSIKVLRKLVDDPDDRVVCYAASHKKFKGSMLERRHEALLSVMSNPDTESSVLSRFVGDPNAEVRAAIAGNEGVSYGDLSKLAGDGDPGVRRVVASREDFDEFVGEYPGALESLVGDDDPRVRQAVAGNSGTPVEVLEVLAKDPVVGVSLEARNRLYY